MKRSWLLAAHAPLAALAVWVSLAGLAAAQLPQTTLTTVFPPGGKQGAQVEVTTSGNDFDEVDKLVFSHPGIKAEPKMSTSSTPLPLPGKFVVTVAGDVPPGVYECRAVGYWGMTNPRAFVVGTREEKVKEGSPNSAESAMPIELGQTINGQVPKAGIDYFRFSAKAGQRMLIDCQAYRIDSKMDPSLAVCNAEGRELASDRDTNRLDPLIDFTAPADGEYVVKLFDFLYDGGPEFFYRLSLHNAPQIDFVFPPAGQPGSNGSYTIYGRNLPGGQPAELKINGKPLEKLSVNIALPGDDAARQQLSFDSIIEPQEAGVDGFQYRLDSAQGASNPVLIGYATAPVVVEQEPNDLKQPQQVTVPCEIAGQFAARRDRDYYTFDAKAGQTFWIDVLSDRIGRRTDAYLVLERIEKDDKGMEKVSMIQEVDDPQRQNQQGVPRFNMQHRDPSWLFQVPADGTYRLMIRNRSSLGSPRMVYRLAIREPQPDFRLVALPMYLEPGNPNNNQSKVDTVLLRKSGSAAMQVRAIRRDGFDGAIELAAENLPPGVTCRKVTLGGKSRSAPLVFVAEGNAQTWAGPIKIVGRAKINDQDVTRVARGGDFLWDVGNYQNGERAFSRVTRDVALSVIDQETAPVRVDLGEGDKMMESSIGGKLEIPIKLAKQGELKGDVKFTAVGLPNELKPQMPTIKANENDGKLTLELKGNNVPTGMLTFCLKGETQIDYGRNPERAKQLDERSKQSANMAKEAAETAKKAEEARQKAEQASNEAQNKVKEAEQQLAQAKTEEKDARQKQLDEARAQAKAAEEAKAAATEAAKGAKEQADQLEQMRKQLEDESKKAQEAAKPKKINVAMLSTPVTIRVAATPINVKVADAGTTKQGEKREIDVNVERLYGFDQQVEVNVQVKNAQGINVKKLTIPKDQTAGKLELSAEKNASPGEHELELKIRVNFNGQNIDSTQTVNFKIEEVKEDASK